MAMAISKDRRVALSVSADHLVGRYDLLVIYGEFLLLSAKYPHYLAFQAAEDAENVQSSCTVHRTKHPGNGSIAIRDDGRVCAIGGWDGK
ncbi:hypothetical protein PHLCEN_2v7179 [Hermanssonia centrifuga]|uniref:Uncharacterized protein n=1 Tax=Hermanssonia centrifuga TaxID=98765 RepID=A0A2R6NX63_9APHY|nr:hypothetical protein PHLCEN_2v7179 [Hermanssonia centrifuga]